MQSFLRTNTKSGFFVFGGIIIGLLIAQILPTNKVAPNTKQYQHNLEEAIQFVESYKEEEAANLATQTPTSTTEYIEHPERTLRYTGPFIAETNFRPQTPTATSTEWWSDEIVAVPRQWRSNPGHPTTTLAYITGPEMQLLKILDLHDSDIDIEDHFGPGNLPSLNDSGGNLKGGAGDGYSGGSSNSSSQSGGNSGATRSGSAGDGTRGGSSPGSSNTSNSGYQGSIGSQGSTVSNNPDPSQGRSSGGGTTNNSSDDGWGGGWSNSGGSVSGRDSGSSGGGGSSYSGGGTGSSDDGWGGSNSNNFSDRSSSGGSSDDGGGGGFTQTVQAGAQAAQTAVKAASAAVLNPFGSAVMTIQTITQTDFVSRGAEIMNSWRDNFESMAPSYTNLPQDNTTRGTTPNPSLPSGDNYVLNTDGSAATPNNSGTTFNPADAGDSFGGTGAGPTSAPPELEVTFTDNPDGTLTVVAECVNNCNGRMSVDLTQFGVQSWKTANVPGSSVEHTVAKPQGEAIATIQAANGDALATKAVGYSPNGKPSPELVSATERRSRVEKFASNNTASDLLSGTAGKPSTGPDDGTRDTTAAVGTMVSYVDNREGNKVPVFVDVDKAGNIIPFSGRTSLAVDGKELSVRSVHSDEVVMTDNEGAYITMNPGETVITGVTETTQTTPASPPETKVRQLSLSVTDVHEDGVRLSIVDVGNNGEIVVGADVSEGSIITEAGGFKVESITQTEHIPETNQDVFEVVLSVPGSTEKIVTSYSKYRDSLNFTSGERAEFEVQVPTSPATPEKTITETTFAVTDVNTLKTTAAANANAVSDFGTRLDTDRFSDVSPSGPTTVRLDTGNGTYVEYEVQNPSVLSPNSGSFSGQQLSYSGVKTLSEATQAAVDTIRDAQADLDELNARAAAGDCASDSQCGQVRESLEDSIGAAKRRLAEARLGVPISAHNALAIAEFAAARKISFEAYVDGQLSGTAGEKFTDVELSQIDQSAVLQNVEDLTIVHAIVSGVETQIPITPATIEAVAQLLNGDVSAAAKQRFINGNPTEADIEELAGKLASAANRAAARGTTIEYQIMQACDSKGTCSYSFRNTNTYDNGTPNRKRYENEYLDNKSTYDAAAEKLLDGTYTREFGLETTAKYATADHFYDPKSMKPAYSVPYWAPKMTTLGTGLSGTVYLDSPKYNPPAPIYEAKPGGALDYRTAISTPALNLNLTVGTTNTFWETMSYDDAVTKIENDKIAVNQDLAAFVQGGSVAPVDLEQRRNDVIRTEKIVTAAEAKVAAAEEELYSFYGPPTLEQKKALDAAADAYEAAKKEAEKAVIAAAQGNMTVAEAAGAMAEIQSYVSNKTSAALNGLKIEEIGKATIIPEELPRYVERWDTGKAKDRKSPERKIHHPDGSITTVPEEIQIAVARYNENRLPGQPEIIEIRAVSETRPDGIGSRRHEPREHVDEHGHPLPEGCSCASDVVFIVEDGRMLDAANAADREMLNSMGYNFKERTNGNVEFADNYMIQYEDPKNKTGRLGTAVHIDIVQPDHQFEKNIVPGSGRAYTAGAQMTEYTPEVEEIRKNTEVSLDSNGDLVIESYATENAALTKSSIPSAAELERQAIENLSSSQRAALAAVEIPSTAPERAAAEQNVQAAAEIDTQINDLNNYVASIYEAAEYSYVNVDSQGVPIGEVTVQFGVGAAQENTIASVEKQIAELREESKQYAEANEKLLAEYKPVNPYADAGDWSSSGSGAGSSNNPVSRVIKGVNEGAKRATGIIGDLLGLGSGNDAGTAPRTSGGGDDDDSSPTPPRYTAPTPGPAYVSALPAPNYESVRQQELAIGELIGGQTTGYVDPFTGEVIDTSTLSPGTTLNPTTPVNPQLTEAVSFNPVVYEITPAAVSTQGSLVTRRPDLEYALNNNDADRFITDPAVSGYFSDAPSTVYDETGTLQYADGIFAPAATPPSITGSESIVFPGDPDYTNIYQVADNTTGTTQNVIAPNQDEAMRLAVDLRDNGPTNIVNPNKITDDPSLFAGLTGPKDNPPFSIVSVQGVKYTLDPAEDGRAYAGTLNYEINVDDRLNRNANTAQLGLSGTRKVEVSLPEVTTLENAVATFADAGFEGNVLVLLNMAEYLGEELSWGERFAAALTSLYGFGADLGRVVGIGSEYTTGDIVSLTVYPNATVACTNIDGIDNGYAYEVLVESKERGEDFAVIRDSRCGSFELEDIVIDIAGHLERKYGFVDLSTNRLMNRTELNYDLVPYDPTLDNAQVITPVVE